MIPSAGLLVPLAFPLRLNDDAIVTVTVTHFAKFDQTQEHAAPTWTTDEVAKVKASHCLNVMHALTSARAALLLRGGMPTMPRGVVGVQSLPLHEPVPGLILFGPCR